MMACSSAVGTDRAGLVLGREVQGDLGDEARGVARIGAHHIEDRLDVDRPVAGVPGSKSVTIATVA